jgi:hypothetical protein
MEKYWVVKILEIDNCFMEQGRCIEVVKGFLLHFAGFCVVVNPFTMLLGFTARFFSFKVDFVKFQHLRN